MGKNPHIGAHMLQCGFEVQGSFASTEKTILIQCILVIHSGDHFNVINFPRLRLLWGLPDVFWLLELCLDQSKVVSYSVFLQVD